MVKKAKLGDYEISREAQMALALVDHSLERAIRKGFVELYTNRDNGTTMLVATLAGMAAIGGGEVKRRLSPGYNEDLADT